MLTHCVQDEKYLDAVRNTCLHTIGECYRRPSLAKYKIYSECITAAYNLVNWLNSRDGGYRALVDHGIIWYNNVSFTFGFKVADNHGLKHLYTLTDPRNTPHYCGIL